MKIYILFTVAILIIILGGVALLVFNNQNLQMIKSFGMKSPVRYTSREECETENRDKCFNFDCGNDNIQLSSNTLFEVLCRGTMQKRSSKNKAWYGHKQALDFCYKWCDDTYDDLPHSGPDEGGISFAEDCLLGCATPLDIQ